MNVQEFPVPATQPGPEGSKPLTMAGVAAIYRGWSIAEYTAFGPTPGVMELRLVLRKEA